MADKVCKPAGRFPRAAKLPDPYAPCPNEDLAASTRTLDNLSEPAYWKDVCPELTVNGQFKGSKPLKRPENTDKDLKQQICDEGVFQVCSSIPVVSWRIAHQPGAPALLPHPTPRRCATRLANRSTVVAPINYFVTAGGARCPPIPSPSPQVGPDFMHWTVDIHSLARNMALLMQHGWPPTFLLMYDEVRAQRVALRDAWRSTATEAVTVEARVRLSRVPVNVRAGSEQGGRDA
jgi:hypothetical protein